MLEAVLILGGAGLFFGLLAILLVLTAPKDKGDLL